MKAPDEIKELLYLNGWAVEDGRQQDGSTSYSLFRKGKHVMYVELGIVVETTSFEDVMRELTKENLDDL